MLIQFLNRAISHVHSFVAYLVKNQHQIDVTSSQLPTLQHDTFRKIGIVSIVKMVIFCDLSLIAKATQSFDERSICKSRFPAIHLLISNTPDSMRDIYMSTHALAVVKCHANCANFNAAIFEFNTEKLASALIKLYRKSRRKFVVVQISDISGFRSTSYLGKKLVPMAPYNRLVKKSTMDDEDCYCISSGQLGIT